MDDEILLATFYNGVTSDLFNHKLYDQEPQTMAELIHSAQSFYECWKCDYCQEKEEGWM